MVDYAWDHAVISDQLYHKIKKSCNFSDPVSSDACEDLLDDFFTAYDVIDMYSLYAPVCVEANQSTISPHLGKINGTKLKFSKYVSLSLAYPT